MPTGPSTQPAKPAFDSLGNLSKAYYALTLRSPNAIGLNGPIPHAAALAALWGGGAYGLTRLSDWWHGRDPRDSTALKRGLIFGALGAVNPMTIADMTTQADLAHVPNPNPQAPPGQSVIPGVPLGHSWGAQFSGWPWGEKQGAAKPKPGKPGPFRPRAEVFALNSKGEVFGGVYPDGTFGVPGGGVDPGEDHATAAVRELKEETGVKAHSAKKLAIEPVKNIWTKDYRKALPAEKRKYLGQETHFVLAHAHGTKGKATDKPWVAKAKKFYPIPEALALMHTPTGPHAGMAKARAKALKHIQAHHMPAALKAQTKAAAFTREDAAPAQHPHIQLTPQLIRRLLNRPEVQAYVMDKKKQEERKRVGWKMPALGLGLLGAGYGMHRFGDAALSPQDRQAVDDLVSLGSQMSGTDKSVLNASTAGTDYANSAGLWYDYIDRASRAAAVKPFGHDIPSLILRIRKDITAVNPNHPWAVKPGQDLGSMEHYYAFAKGPLAAMLHQNDKTLGDGARNWLEADDPAGHFKFEPHAGPEAPLGQPLRVNPDGSLPRISSQALHDRYLAYMNDYLGKTHPGITLAKAEDPGTLNHSQQMEMIRGLQGYIHARDPVYSKIRNIAESRLAQSEAGPTAAYSAGAREGVKWLQDVPRTAGLVAGGLGAGLLGYWGLKSLYNHFAPKKKGPELPTGAIARVAGTGSGPGLGAGGLAKAGAAPELEGTALQEIEELVGRMAHGQKPTRGLFEPEPADNFDWSEPDTSHAAVRHPKLDALARITGKSAPALLAGAGAGAWWMSQAQGSQVHRPIAGLAPQGQAGVQTGGQAGGQAQTQAQDSQLSLPTVPSVLPSAEVARVAQEDLDASHGHADPGTVPPEAKYLKLMSKIDPADALRTAYGGAAGAGLGALAGALSGHEHRLRNTLLMGLLGAGVGGAAGHYAPTFGIGSPAATVGPGAGAGVGPGLGKAAGADGPPQGLGSYLSQVGEGFEVGDPSRYLMEPVIGTGIGVVAGTPVGYLISRLMHPHEDKKTALLRSLLIGGGVGALSGVESGMRMAHAAGGGSADHQAVMAGYGSN